MGRTSESGPQSEFRVWLALIFIQKSMEGLQYHRLNSHATQFTPLTVILRKFSAIAQNGCLLDTLRSKEMRAALFGNLSSTFSGVPNTWKKRHL